MGSTQAVDAVRAKLAVDVITGYFDADNCEDIALTGGAGWSTLPVAASNCDGTFTIHNDQVPEDYARWAAGSGVKAFGGDFDNDGFGDVGLVGGSGWSSIPIAFRD